MSYRRDSSAETAFVPGRPARKGKTVKRYALATALALSLGGAAQAAVIDLVFDSEASSQSIRPAYPQPHAADLAITSRAEIVTPPTNLSELPEPEVFAMMLLGLILIGYRAGRDSSETFK